MKNSHLQLPAQASPLVATKFLGDGFEGKVYECLVGDTPAAIKIYNKAADRREFNLL
jgi:hypothetical protein